MDMMMTMSILTKVLHHHHKLSAQQTKYLSQKKTVSNKIC